MKSFPYLMIVVIALAFTGCSSNKNMEGEVISVPAVISMDDFSKGAVNDVEFRGDYVKVKLENGDVVQAIATKEQMEQAFFGEMTKATLEKDEKDNWKIIKLEKAKE